MQFNIKWDNKANKQLDKLEIVITKRIVKAVDDLKENPFSKDIRKLQDREGYRLRVGDYRVIFTIEEDSIKILKVGHRKNVYER